MKESYQGEILNLVIFTDSLSSLRNLEESNNAYNDPDVYRIFYTISELQEKGKEVTLVWVPAHVGIPGIEQADALAKAATTKDTTECWIPATIKDIKRIIDQNVLQQWQTRWEDKEEKHYKLVEKKSVGEEQIPMCLKEEGDFDLQTPSWKMRSKSTPL